MYASSQYINFLEPSGPVQACNGTALPFTSQYINIIVISQKLMCTSH